MKQGPLSVAIKANNILFRFYSGGILQESDICSNSNSNHAVLLIGIDKESYIFKNSWGVEWGEKSEKILKFL